MLRRCRKCGTTWVCNSWIECEGCKELCLSCFLEYLKKERKVLFDELLKCFGAKGLKEQLKRTDCYRNVKIDEVLVVSLL